jgi:hypothetical protein
LQVDVTTADSWFTVLEHAIARNALLSASDGITHLTLFRDYVILIPTQHTIKVAHHPVSSRFDNRWEGEEASGEGEEASEA